MERALKKANTSGDGCPWQTAENAASRSAIKPAGNSGAGFKNVTAETAVN
jgi:hypothetical protein